MLDAVDDTMGVVVGGVDTPVTPRVGMRYVFDSIRYLVPHIRVR